MCVYQKTVMYCLHLEVDTIHRTGIVEHFIHFSQCYITSESRIIMVESNRYSGAVLCWLHFVDGDLWRVTFPPISYPRANDHQDTVAVIAGNLTPDC